MEEETSSVKGITEAVYKYQGTIIGEVQVVNFFECAGKERIDLTVDGKIVPEAVPYS